MSTGTNTVGADDDRPNVLWIMTDQHNAKCTSWGQFPTDVSTPSLDRLAEAGVRFDRAQCQNPICTPSRTSYLTGQYPSNHGKYGLTNAGGTVDAPTLFGALRERGYRTGAFGKMHTPVGLIEDDLTRMKACSGTTRHDRPNDTEYNDYLRREGAHSYVDEEFRGGPSTDGYESAYPYEYHPEHWTVDRAIEFVEASARTAEPFCAWVSLNRPHQAYAPPTRFWEQYSPGEIELPPTAFEDLDDKPPHQREFRGPADPDAESPFATFEPGTQEAFLRRKLRGYLGCVSMVDHCVGRLLDALEAEGLREDTIVIYCSDHGDFAAEHGFPEKAPGISYDAITRVPFVWSWPERFREGAVVDELVETVDLFPTLLSVIDGAEVPAADGEDLTGLLTGEDRSPVRDYAITENAWSRTVRTAEQKLTVYPSGFHGEDSEQYLEFYDLADDPWEAENLAESADPPTEEIERHRDHLLDFFQTQRRAISTHHVEPRTDSLADGTVTPRDIAAYLDEQGGTNYL